MAASNPSEPTDDLPPFVVTSFSALSFLVIDDNPFSLELMEKVLHLASVGTVRKASSVFAAAGLLADTAVKTDCIICDHYMEGMTGLALLQRIRAGRNTVIARDVRFILLTGDTSKPLLQAAVALDVSGLIKKPVNVNAALKVVHMAFGKQLKLKAVADYARVVLPNAAGSPNTQD